MLNSIKKELNKKLTENGAPAYSSTLNSVLDMFAFGAAYRNRSDEDMIALFECALDENKELAMKCLFWIRDVRGGAGERHFFRVCMKWLAETYPDWAREVMIHIPDFGRFDDLYCFVDTPLQQEALALIGKHLYIDVNETFPSLCAKWAKSCNASSEETRHFGRLTANVMGLTYYQYQKMLAKIRNRLNVIERLMSDGRWNEIEFEKVSSNASLRYSHCFSTREELKERYADFISDNKTKVNSVTLYPYDCALKAHSVSYMPYGSIEREAVNKHWENLPDYIGDNDASNFMCVCDTSGSMTWGSSNPKPIDVATSLAMYFAERAKGPFHNHYISFSSRPQLIEIVGRDFVEKVEHIRRTNLYDNTNLEAVFDMLLRIAKSQEVKEEDFVKNLFIISDMEIDAATDELEFTTEDEKRNNAFKSLMECIRENWESQTNIPFPKLYYWNVNAQNDTVLSLGPDVSYISGASPAILKQVLSGKTGWELCLETLLSDRYKVIK